MATHTRPDREGQRQMNLWMPLEVRTKVHEKAATEAGLRHLPAKRRTATEVMRRLAQGYATGVVRLPSEEDATTNDAAGSVNPAAS